MSNDSDFWLAEKPKVEELQMDWLRSEDLKEEKERNRLCSHYSSGASYGALSLPSGVQDGSMHYERAPRFRRSKPDEAPPPLRCAVQGFAPLRRRSRVTAVVCPVGKDYRRA